jgi:hypothetical protein
MPAVLRPKTRRLQNKDPRIVENYIHHYLKLARKQNLLPRVQKLDSTASYPASSATKMEYKKLDEIWCEITRYAEKKCRKLRMDQVAFSLELQQVNRSLKAVTLLKKKKEGEKVSSRLLSRSVQKAAIHPSCNAHSLVEINDLLKNLYNEYYNVKREHTQKRGTYLENLAEALVKESNIPKLTLLTQLKERETQRSVAHKLRYLRGKGSSGGITMVTVENDDGSVTDLLSKCTILCYHEGWIQKPNNSLY